jgi:hypothetical protein
LNVFGRAPPPAELVELPDRNFLKENGLLSPFFFFFVLVVVLLTMGICDSTTNKSI